MRLALSLRRFLRPILTTSLLTLSASACAGSSPDAIGAQEASHPLIGNPSPSFQLDSVNGFGKVSMVALSGKVVIVDFWATWCEPCKKSFPKLQSIHAKFKGSGVTVVGLSEDDDKGGIKEFANALGADFPLAWDSDKAVAGKWQPGSMPATFIVDRKGLIRFMHRGYHDGEELEIEKEVKSLL